jgi:alkaline phosphatase
MEFFIRGRKFNYQKAVFIFLSVILMFQISFLPKQVLAASNDTTQLKATSSQSWYNSNWKYRKEITIDNTGNASDLSNYQVNVNLTASNFNWSKALANGEDIRFTDSDGITELDSWIETYTINNTNIWVKVPIIPASSTKKIYLYYGLKSKLNLKAGLITDAHGITDINTKLGSHAIPHIHSFVTRMNDTVHPDFTIDMGDKINTAGLSSSTLDLTKVSGHGIDIANLIAVRNAYSGLKNNHYYVIGNHDWANITKAELQTALGIDYNHKSFDVGNYHVIILDAQVDGNQKAGMGHITDEEKAWLKAELAKTKKKTIIFTHQGLGDQSVVLNHYFAARPIDAKIDNSSDIRPILENAGKVIAVFQSHTHWDNITTINNIPYIYINSLVEDNANEWAEMAIYNNQLINIVFRQNDSTKKFYVWDFANKKWFNNGGQVFSLFDDFDGDSGQWSVLAGSAKSHWEIRQGGGYLAENNGAVPGGYRLLKSTYKESPNYIAQAKIMTSTSNSSTVGFVTRLTDINNFNALYLNSNASTDYRWSQMNAGVWSAIFINSGYVPDTKWHTLKLVKVGTTNTLFYDGTKVLSASSNNLSDAYFGLCNFNAPVYFDNLYIRNYATPEPTVSVGSEGMI